MKLHIITHNDLDGVCAFLALSWFYKGSEITYTAVSNAGAIREEIQSWLSKYSFDDFDRVIICDLDCYDAKSLIEHPKVLIIDHHQGHFDRIQTEGNYTTAKQKVVVYSSASKLIYRIFSAVKPEVLLTPAQKALIAICDDYDSYTLKLQQSVHMNWVFFSLNNRFEAFFTRFYHGFSGFSAQEQSMIKIRKDLLEKTIRELEVYQGKVEGYSAVCTTADECINEVHDYLVDFYKKDISIVIVPKSRRVTWRRSKSKDIPLQELAKNICEGGGHKYAAGGKITEAFMNLCKTFYPV